MITSILINFAAELGLARQLDSEFPGPPNDLSTLQVRIYVLKICKVDFGYLFQWPHQGRPFSDVLCARANEYSGREDYKEFVDDLMRSMSFSPWSERVVEGAKRLIRPPDGIAQDAWLELVVSLYNAAESQHVLKGRARSVADLKESPRLVKLINIKLMEGNSRLRAYERFIDDAWQRIWSCVEEVPSMPVPAQ